LLVGLILLPFAASVVAAMLPRNARNAEAWLAGTVCLVALAITISFHGQVASGAVPQAVAAWLPDYGLDLRLRMDGLAWMFSLLVTGMGLLVVLYARYYLSPEDPASRFFALFLGFMGSMLGVVTAGNLVQLVFFWELTSVFSFLLIGYRHRNPAARAGARMALVVTSAGGLCLLGGVLLLGRIAGSYDLDAVLAAGDAIRAHPHYLAALVLVAIGALTKSAQFPFHFWLPQAMAAPTPVSAYLHSAAMVKLGVFLLVRLWPALSGTDAWMWIVGLAGLVTLVLGAYLAIFQKDLKGLLAYSTISHLGLITVLIGMNSELALVAAIFHVMNHATFKASLFMAAGIIDHEAGTREIRRLSGLYRFMPITTTLAVVSAAAMAGVPLLNGFLTKEMFFAEALGVRGPLPTLDRALPYIATVWGMFSIAYSVRFVLDVFMGEPARDLPREPHEPPRWMRLPMELLVLACVAVGVAPAFTVGPILTLAAHAVLGAAMPSFDLAIWHGFGPPVYMSLLASAGGLALYLVLRRRIDRIEGGAPLLPALDAGPIFERALMRAWRWARLAEAALGTHRLQTQLLILVTLAVGTGAWIALTRGADVGPLAPSPFDYALLLVWIVGAACALGAAWQAKFHRLFALLLSGGAGLAVCLTFVWLSAPDLALTQMLVEIVTTVLLLLGLRWLPKRIPRQRAGGVPLTTVARRARDLAIACAAGGGLGALAYLVMTRPLPEHAVSRFFLENALPGGGGANVVNVIIVDFRGFDTLGEIAVLGVVALVVYSLLRRFRPAPSSIEPLAQQRAQSPREAAQDLALPALLMRGMFPAIVVFCLYLLLRGHNLPGGGFVAGVTLAIGVILQYMADGTRRTEQRLAIRPPRWIGAGLLLAIATGMGSLAAGFPFLTSHTAKLHLPLVGELHLPTAFFFDTGVFLLVVGAIGLILIALAHQSTRAHRSSGKAA
jgi:multicomponent K+:H+ antiporter subunit A